MVWVHAGYTQRIWRIISDVPVCFSFRCPSPTDSRTGEEWSGGGVVFQASGERIEARAHSINEGCGELGVGGWP